ncbi:leucine--tRNA ligase [bacterium]|nr:leucine--tRNA ligase [bacterium]
MMYNYKDIENKQKDKWNRLRLYDTPERPDRKYYLMEMYAYPSGDIHIGHFRNYTLGDVLWRYLKMNGYDLLHPFGWDAFGLPAEEAAIKRGESPSAWTMKNIKRSRETLQRLGISYDWEREVITCQPDYYKWTQWIFLQLYKKGLAYKDRSYVNWCANCNTVLANEQVHDGKCWRCESEVEKRELEQWYFRITEYAERLLNDIEKLENWPEAIKNIQKNWIGRSEGAMVNFRLDDLGLDLPIFTTRLDTIFGVTFMAIAPEHKLIPEILKISPHAEQIREYVRKALMKPETERTSDEREKDGVFTGLYAINPFDGSRIQIWVADYVLAAYGTGMVMAVPAHDQRDFEFAKKYNIPINVVIDSPDRAINNDCLNEAYTEYGIMINSGEFSGLSSEKGMKTLVEHARKNGFGEASVVYRLRDWLISRQRYWGAPIPVIYCDSCGVVPVPEKELPVLLPDDSKVDFLPKGRSPLEEVPEFVNVPCPLCGKPARRDVDTMDTYVCSSWYHLRYLNPKDDDFAFSSEEAKKWLPVDFYIGGAEHATSHLLYFRFITKVLKDLGYLEVDEPVRGLFNHGMVLDGHGEKMSKSRGNVVSPVRLIEEIGIDAARISILFFAPPGREILWNEEGTKGATRFLKRIYTLIENIEPNQNEVIIDEDGYAALNEEDKELFKLTHRLIKRVDRDIHEMQFNTAIAALMEALNDIDPEHLKVSSVKNFVVKAFLRLLNPFAPYLAEYFGEKWFSEETILHAEWPSFNEKYTRFKDVTIALQINGKLRGTIDMVSDSTQEEAVALAREVENINRYLEQGEIKKIIWVPNKLLNFVVR